MGSGLFVPEGTKGIKFTMLRQQHYEQAQECFGQNDFDRLFVVHAIEPAVLEERESFLAERRIHFLTIREVVADIICEYKECKRPAGLRHSLIGDLWHLLVGFCGYCPSPQQ